MVAERPFDVAIVAAGQAGCTLAGRIAEKGVNPSTGEPLRIAVFDRGRTLHLRRERGSSGCQPGICRHCGGVGAAGRLPHRQEAFQQGIKAGRT
ncbi:hypothetical protein MYX82_09800 [Acidobacteria bacterium AH-259-D05]|nr:hypothetical protein [Acidobacteria bacterium AH-259-D05]